MCPDCGHPADSHGDWNWPIKCLYGPCDCRTPGANLRIPLAPDGDPADPDYMCPNCVTPWKCNGPHLDPTEGGTDE